MLPNFFIVGAAKSGTTSLYNYLKQHPQIFLPTNKEPQFFSIEEKFFNDLEYYKLLYLEAQERQAIGDMSTTYLYYYQETIKNMKTLIPNHQSLKFVIVLRNPIDRVFSHYLMNRFLGLTYHDFDTVIRKERIAPDKINYVEMGLYSKQVQAYLENFSNVKIYLYEDLQNNLKNTLNDLFLFLEIGVNYPINTKYRHRVSGTPKSLFFNLMLNKLAVILYRASRPFEKILYSDKLKLRFLQLKYNANEIIEFLRTKMLKKETMSESSREYLKEFYREDILKLQSLINRDISHWLK